MAKFLGPNVVFRHVGEAAESTETPNRSDAPACLFHHFSMKRRNRCLTRVNAAAGQLVFRVRLHLMGQQHLTLAHEDGVDPGSSPVSDALPDRLSDTRNHGLGHFAFFSYIAGGMAPRPFQGNPMNLGARIAWDDTVLPFQLDRTDTRGRVARLDGVLQRVLAQHDYPPAVEALVAEAVLLTALIGQTIKLRWKLSLQIRGDGPIRLVATDYFAPSDDGAPARIRAYAGYDRERVSPEGDPFPQIGQGYFAVLIDQGPDTVPYQGITPIAGVSLAACAETYFAQSEQLPTRFALSFGQSQTPGEGLHWRAGGVMLQQMPKASPYATGGGSGDGGLLLASDILDGDDAEMWHHVNVLLDSAEDIELIGPSVQPTDLLVRLFHEDGPRVFGAQPLEFGCTCSADRVRRSLSIYSRKDIATMTTDEGIVTADCQFCGARYEFDPDTLGFEAEVPTEPEDGDA